MKARGKAGKGALLALFPPPADAHPVHAEDLGRARRSDWNQLAIAGSPSAATAHPGGS